MRPDGEAGPRFLCFGTTRSGTTFLYRHLRAHPQLWLPPQKELHYFSYQRARGFANRKHLKHLSKIVPFARAALRGVRGPAAELAWQARYLFGPRSDAWHRSLWELPAPWITGQFEPTYAVLPSDAIEAVHHWQPELRLIYMMRDPLERTWSSVTKSCAKNKRRPMAEVPESEIFTKLDRSAIRMSSYLDHIERWERVFGRRKIFFGFFDEIECDPAGLLARLCAFIGIDPPAHLDATQLRAPVNDTRRYKVEIPPHIERAIARRLIKPTRALQHRFGGYTDTWREHLERVLGSA